MQNVGFTDRVEATMARKIMVVALLLLVGCRSSPIITHPLNIEDMTPLEFLIHLESYHKSDCQYVRAVTGGWVKEEHLPRLFDLLGSDEKCTLPVSAFSSPHIDMGRGSKVGREAGFLIKNYMGQRYPAPLGSRISDADKEELGEWWKEHRKKDG